MKVRDVVMQLEELNLPESHVLLALPGGRFSPLTLVEPFVKVDEAGEKRVVIVYPHPRDVSALPGPGDSHAPTRGDLGEIVDKFFDLIGAGKGDGTDPKTEG